MTGVDLIGLLLAAVLFVYLVVALRLTPKRNSASRFARNMCV